MQFAVSLVYIFFLFGYRHESIEIEFPKVSIFPSRHAPQEIFRLH